MNETTTIETPTCKIYCGSFQIKSELGGGWWHGVHFLEGVNYAETCPRCGAPLSVASTTKADQ